MAQPTREELILLVMVFQKIAIEAIGIEELKRQFVKKMETVVEKLFKNQN